MKRNQLIKTILIVVILGIAIVAIIGYKMWNKPHRDLANEKPHFVLSAAALMEEYENDDVAANAKYLGKIIEISGVVNEIQENETITVFLETASSPLASISCELAPGIKATELENGQNATLRGTCSGKLSDVVLSRCVIIKM